MPLYEYICQDCGIRFERLVFSSDKEQPRCSCGGEGTRVVSAACLSGTGYGGSCSLGSHST